MKQTFTVSEKLAFPAEKVWDVMTKPADLNIHGVSKSEKISDLEWIEQTTPEIENHCTATINEAKRRVEVKSQNSKFAHESDDIVFIVDAIDANTTEVSIDYCVETSAVFNVLAFKLFGEKIMHFSSNSIFKHIEEKCKK